MIATNGLLIDDNVIETCRKYGTVVAIGIDGFNPELNEARVGENQEETFAEATRVIRRLVDSGLETCASVSITPNNVDKASQFYGFFRELGLSKFGFNFLKGRALLRYPGIDPESYFHQAAEAVISAYESGGIKGFEYQMEKKIIAMSECDFFPIDCTCYGSQIVIQPNGQVTNCPFYRNDIGKVDELPEKFRIWENLDVKQWRERLPLFGNLYNDCDTQSLCGGGCAWNNIDLSGNHLDIDRASRIFSEKVFDYLIWSREKEVLW